MRHGVLIFLLAFFSAALIADIAVRIAKAGPPSRAQVLTDEQNGTIRFMIDGREAARIDAAGLHVRADIAYAGAIKDTPYTEGADAN